MKDSLKRLLGLAVLRGDEMRDETDRYQVRVYLGDIRELLLVVAAAERVAQVHCTDCHETSAAIEDLKKTLGIKETL